ncbi:MAG: helix-turn-helix domain-containing protein [Blastocatellia bacterium]|nr:helix-turn-helix domain-containing protein [Blastocatellia bacterium]
MFVSNWLQFVFMNGFTTAEVAARLGVAQPTVKLWCQQGRFPSARLHSTPRGPIWLIPEVDIKHFIRPKRGRPGTLNKKSKVVKGP